MSKRLKVTPEMTNASMVYDVVETVRQHDGYLNYREIARILDEPDTLTYYALLYAEQLGYIHGDGGFYVRNGAGGARIWHFDKRAPYPYEIMDGKRHAYKVKRGIRGPDLKVNAENPRAGHNLEWVYMEMSASVEIDGEKCQKDIRYWTPEPTRWCGYRVDYETVALFDTLEDAQRWIRRDKKRLTPNVKPYYYHVRVLIPSGLICPHQGAE